MIVRAWRIVKRKHVRLAFSGEGARRFGGRWNSPGTPVVYCAGSRALAALEMLVHLSSSDLLSTYVLFEVEIEEGQISELPRLPANWRSDPAPESARAAGQAWIERGRTVALRVPSAVVPEEQNYLLNPNHQDFASLQIKRVPRLPGAHQR